LEVLQNLDLALKSRNPVPQSRFCFRIITELGVEVLAVWGGRQSSIENGLYQKGVVRLQCISVCCAERIGQFLSRGIDVVPKSLSGKVKTTAMVRSVVSNVQGEYLPPRVILRSGLCPNLPNKPEEAFCGCVFLCLELVEDKSLKCLGLRRGSELALTDFLCGRTYEEMVRRKRGTHLEHLP
jgi:hypothetical protein